MPVIPALWEVEVGVSLEVRSSKRAWPTRRNPVSTKNTNLDNIVRPHLYKKRKQKFEVKQKKTGMMLSDLYL